MKASSLLRGAVWLAAAAAYLAAALWLGERAWRQWFDQEHGRRRERIATLVSAAKDGDATAKSELEDLTERLKRFSLLGPTEQDRIRRLQKQLEQEPDSAELRRVMRNYYDWLKSRDPYQVAELRELPIDGRVQKIESLIKRQAEADSRRPALAGAVRTWRSQQGPVQAGGKRAGWLSPQDVDGLLQWFDQYIARQGDAFLKKFPESGRQQLVRELNQTKDEIRRHELLTLIWLRWQLDNPGKTEAPSDQEMAALRAKLSPETQKRLEAKPKDEQWRILSSLIPLFVLRQYAAKRIDGALPAVSEEELADFFEKQLTDAERTRLMELDSEDMTLELWKMYVRWKLPRLSPHDGDRPVRNPSKRPKSFPKPVEKR